ncbi:OmpA family protein [Actinomadura sp. GC306]|uniref:OmpA family protein n=1 Tax=Actinomadura sp. GC306 TaxID=2530367 RepID=UPI0010519D4C|nr:OmpA family protein [Actinomadura sp. GC306]TDC60811.1 OmpA family protein [Actinomadura sp. GC306]
MRLVLPLAASLAGVVFVVGCSGGGADKEDAPVAGGVAGGAVFAKEGRFGGTGAPLQARVQIKGVERRGEKSVLRYSVTSLDSSKKSLNFAIDLLDPVGRLLYKATGSTGGETFEPGATREMTTEYPAIPRSVTKVTALTRGTAGEFTGIPVTGPDDASAASLARLRGNPVELYGITEGEVRDTVTSGQQVTVGLRADVLFERTSADLSGRAGNVLDETEKEIKSKAAGSLSFEGHTDSSGDDTANVALSKKRAEAVMREMKSRLGDGFSYTASGRGAAEPIAAEGDVKARERNRRVEITYEVKRPETPSPESGPAGFRPEDGKKVASRSAKFGDAKRRIDVKPFYRDGAYIVAVFDIVNEGPGPTPPDASYSHRDYPGGVFTSFSIQVPGSKDVHRTVRIGTVTPGANGSYVDPGRAVGGVEVNRPVRGFAYLPAPPGKVTSVTFDAGPFGKLGKVPVRQGG